MGFYFYDLSGGINISESKTALGLSTKKITWSKGENVEIYQNRGICRQNGNMLLCQLPQTATITGLFEILYDEQRYLLINTLQGKLYLYKQSSGTLTCLKSDFSVCENISYTKFLGGVCISNGIDEPVFFDPSDLSSPLKSMNATSADNVSIRGLAMSAYNGRLWIATGSTLYYSALGRYNDWSTANDAGYISDFYSDYSKITALCPYREYLAIYKSDKIYFLSGFSEDDFEVNPFADCGVDSQNAVLTVNNKQYFFNKGVFNLAQVGELGQTVVSSDISTPIKSFVDTYNKTNANKICIISYESKNQIWFFIPQKNRSYQNTVWIYDYLNKAWFVRKIPQSIICATEFNQKPITGSVDGKIYIEDVSNSFCGTPISFCWQSPFFAFNTPGRKKTINKFEFILDDTYDNVFDFYTQKNYEDEKIEDQQQIKTTNPANLIWTDSDTYWANDDDGFCWAKSIDSKERALISNKNISVQIGVSGSTLNQDCCIIGLEFDDFDYY